MIDALAVYLISQAANLVWFSSPLKLSIYSLLTKKISFRHEDFDLLLLTVSPLLKVFTCPFCFSFWTSIIVSAFLFDTFTGFIVNTSTSIVLIYLYENVINFLKGVD
jgi:hypothetical protein